MICGGNCPVQGSAIRAGWLFYFRARSGWELYAWAPGSWVPQDPFPTCAEAAVDAWVAGKLGDASLVFSDSESMPEPPVGESDYPGWWSWEYAEQVAEWAIERVLACKECDAK